MDKFEPSSDRTNKAIRELLQSLGVVHAYPHDKIGIVVGGELSTLVKLEFRKDIYDPQGYWCVVL